MVDAISLAEPANAGFYGALVHRGKVAREVRRDDMKNWGKRWDLGVAAMGRSYGWVAAMGRSYGWVAAAPTAS